MEEQSDRKREHRKNSSDEERKQPRVEGARNNTQSQPSTSQGTRVVAGSNQRQGAMKKNHRRKNFTPVRKRRPEISGLTGSGNLQQPFQCYDPEEQQEAEGATAGPMPKSPRNAAPKFTPFGGRPMLYSISHELNHQYRLTAECYDFESWIALEDPPFFRIKFAVTAYQNKVWVIGGCIRWAYYVPWLHMTTAEIYDPTTDEWQTSEANLNDARSRLSVEVLDGKLYAVGGRNANEALATVEVCEGGSEWQRVSSMNHGRADFGITTYGTDKLIVGGGTDMTSYTVTTMEEYSCLTDSWTLVVQGHVFHHERSFFSLVNVDNILLAFGGDTTKSISYRLEGHHTWTEGQEMPSQDCTAIALNGIAYLVGGQPNDEGDEISILHTVACYNPITHELSEAPGLMQFGGFLPGLALIYY